MTESEGKEACEAAVAEADVTRRGTRDDRGRRRIATSMRAICLTGIVDAGAGERGTSAGEGRFEAMKAKENNGCRRRPQLGTREG